MDTETLKATYVSGVGYVLTTDDGRTVWSDDWPQHAPEDATVTRDVGRLLAAVGVVIKFEDDD